MLSELTPILWKEWREIFNRRGMRGGLTSWAIMVALLGILMPVQVGAEWLRTPILLLVWSWIPVLMVISLVCDSFAGERERHTLETLLASRLPDLAILAGKMIVITLYGWSIEVVGLLLGAVVINLTHWSGSPQFYQPGVFLGVLAVNFGAVLLISGLGVLISLRAQTVRQAYQRMSWIFYAVFLVPILLGQILPAELRLGAADLLAAQPQVVFYIGILVILAVLNAGVFALARLRFQRARMIGEQ